MRIVQKVFLIIIILFFFNACFKEKKDTLIICCAGDSLMKPIPFHFRKIIDRKSHVKILNLARSGYDTGNYKDYMLRHWRDWKNKRCDYILIQLGTNDAIRIMKGKYPFIAFKQNLYFIVRKFKEFKGNKFKNSKILIASVPPVYFGKFGDEVNNLIREKINPAIKEIAEKERIFFVDNYSKLNGKINFYDKDGVHPNHEGEILLAKNWLFSIKITLRQFRRLGKLRQEDRTSNPDL
ncbi:SGNH/GDSL hydrolase family protein [Candidatus Aminicenantes bacterium AC-708-M15]|nr:SGNH/GDSL hydrolase family protein [SCandidatus Aminicenantes bacterium Aminicenantia_JdfR_composite]MCP2604480.1 SGNH/GDSL hydrolase family protein [Candidatus Aminicenantes bacterium AC-708-M15]MCP2605689.1 SGNH/GDSL hydrolase family protein [Candidatus Aminicenantes bacterium AC-335-O07]MCP2606334.1 SGNH/GDSL hydrolase family protein [Candidatus Aminicenantes bacterium AC-708-I09]MCP2621047.1 SGNH/GDSL hydrolase family protein [Candidatus Aminicenantes bacterium AC-334-E05]